MQTPFVFSPASEEYESSTNIKLRTIIFPVVAAESDLQLVLNRQLTPDLSAFVLQLWAGQQKKVRLQRRLLSATFLMACCTRNPRYLILAHTYNVLSLLVPFASQSTDQHDHSPWQLRLDPLCILPIWYLFSPPPHQKMPQALLAWQSATCSG